MDLSESKMLPRLDLFACSDLSFLKSKLGKVQEHFFLWSDADKQCATDCNISKKQRPRFQKKSRIQKDGNGRQRLGKSQERCLKVNMLELLFIIQVLHRNTVADGGIVGVAGQKKTHSEGNNRIELTK